MARWVGLAMMALLVAAPAAARSDPGVARHEATAVDAVPAGEEAAAAKALREALAADQKNARLHLGAGLAATLERRDEEAKDEFERALVLDPKLTRARALLGEVLYRLGDLSEAIRTYETLTADSPEDRDAQATLERWRREADLHDRMQRAIGSHFTVSFEGPAEAELAAQALESLDRAYWRIGPLLGVYPSDPIPVVLYTSEQFRDITRSPSWAAGAYDGTIRVPMRGALDKGTERDRRSAHARRSRWRRGRQSAARSRRGRRLQQRISPPHAAQLRRVLVMMTSGHIFEPIADGRSVRRERPLRDHD